MKRIVCYHLYNDFSGSPKVLKMVLEGLLEKGYRVDLVTSKGGVLDELGAFPNLKRHSYSYSFSDNALVTTLRYMAIQVFTFFGAFRWAFQKDVVFYINTILPAGPALAGRIMGKRLIYHYHENAFAKGRFYKLLAALMQKLANEIICVSAYQASFLHRKEGVTVIPNALPKSFTDNLHPDTEAAFNRKTVLMLASLKGYKGIREFMELAGKLPQYKFLLVLNDTREQIDNYLKVNNLENKIGGGNLIVLPRQTNVVTFYNDASIVVVLTDPKQVIETFGLTALEAISAGLPVIVPTVGGIAEMVDDGENGYKDGVRDLELVEKHIRGLLEDEKLYAKLSRGALRRSRHYDKERMMAKLVETVDK